MTIDKVSWPELANPEVSGKYTVLKPRKTYSVTVEASDINLAEECHRRGLTPVFELKESRSAVGVVHYLGLCLSIIRKY